MRTIREFEERVHVDFATGEIPGFVHLYAGEEASATGICMHLNQGRLHRQYAPRPRPLHRQGRRSHRHDGGDLGQATGTCKGKGGSMHIADLEVGMLGANGIVGGGGPLICGTALAIQAARQAQQRRPSASSAMARPTRAPSSRR
jgi:TPP-dependent pyruvate/acetoin dehydrogenase alpha subunit